MSDKDKTPELIAAAQINAFAGPPAGITFNSNFGFQTATRDSAGVYQLELDDKQDAKKLVVNVSLYGTSPGEIAASLGSQTGDTKKIQVSTFDENDVPVDSLFFITVYRVRD